MSDSLGTARLDLVIDASTFQAAIAQAKNAAHGLGTEAEAAFTKADTQAKRAAVSLIRFAETFGLSAENAKLMNAALRGVPVEVLTAMQAKLKQVKDEAAAAAYATELLGIKAQHAADGEAFKQMAADAQRVNRLREAVAAFTPELERLEAAEAHVAGQQNFIKQLQQTALAATHTRSEMLELRAAELGVSNEAAPFIAKLKAQEQALTGLTKSTNAYGLSAKQQVAAMRQVPAQITDIFVSLQGGQNPLTVLIQQGGQLKDVFGGIRPAAQALGGAIAGLVNPYTAAAAAVAAFAFAITQAENDSKRLENSLILTGNAAGSSVENLRAMGRELAAISDESERSATNVVAQVAATGRFTEEQVKMVSAAAIAMEEATGRSIQKTIDEFAALGRDPVEGLLRLNEAVADGTNVVHFLTEEQIKQVQALRDSGDAAGATELAARIYFDTINDRAPQAAANLSHIHKWWKAIVDTSGEIADQARQRVEELLGAMENVYTFNQKFANLISGNGFRAPGDGATPSPAAPKVPAGNVVDSEAYRRKVQAEKEYGTLVQGNLTAEQRQVKEIADIRAKGRAAGIDAAKVEADVAASQRKFAEDQAKRGKHGAGAARSLANAESKADLQAFKDQLAVEQAAITQGTQVLQAQYSARLVSSADYFAKQRAFLEQGQSAEEKALQGQIAALRGRTVAGKDSVDVLRQIGELEAQLAKVRTDSATKLTVLSIQEQAYNEERLNSIEDYEDGLKKATSSLQARTMAAVAAVGMGDEEAQQVARLTAIYQEQADALDELAKQLRRREIDPDKYAAEVRIRQEATDAQVRIVREGYDAMKAAEADWVNGLTSGLANWLNETAKVAQQVGAIVSRSLDRASDALAEFALTGKLNIRQLLADILTDIVKFLAKRAIMQFVMAFLPGFGSFGNAAVSPNLTLGAKSGGFANGGAFDQAGLTKFARGDVFNQPTAFKFGRGGSNLGIMGEAGPEAIMPLKRTAGGKLGVVAQGMGGGGVTNIHVTTNVMTDGTAQTNVTAEGDQMAAYENFTREMRAIAQDAINRAQQPGGSLWRAGAGVQV